MNGDTKNEYIAVYDSGTGGVWFIINAHSSHELKDRFSFLEIVEKRPIWLDEIEYKRLKSNSYQDIDEDDIPALQEMREAIHVTAKLA